MFQVFLVEPKIPPFLRKLQIMGVKFPDWIKTEKRKCWPMLSKNIFEKHRSYEVLKKNQLLKNDGGKIWFFVPGILGSTMQAKGGRRTGQKGIHSIDHRMMI